MIHIRVHIYLSNAMSLLSYTFRDSEKCTASLSKQLTFATAVDQNTFFPFETFVDSSNNVKNPVTFNLPKWTVS